MSSLRGLLRLLILLYALYTLAYGVWAMLQPDEAWGGNLPLSMGMDETTVRTIGLGQTAIAIYEFLTAWRGDRASYLSIAGVRTLSYVVLNRVWEWGLGWPAVDLNFVVVIITVEAALL